MVLKSAFDFSVLTTFYQVTCVLFNKFHSPNLWIKSKEKVKIFCTVPIKNFYSQNLWPMKYFKDFLWCGSCGWGESVSIIYSVELPPGFILVSHQSSWAWAGAETGLGLTILANHPWFSHNMQYVSSFCFLVAKKLQLQTSHLLVWDVFSSIWTWDTKGGTFFWQLPERKC